ncbi:LytTR family DNA-binding domain-containing protein [Spirosoma humi]
MLTCIIVEDETMARTSLQRLCKQHSALEVLGVFDNTISALDFLAEQDIDLIWLSVEMPGLSGFDLLEQLPSVPYVILTTRKIEYAFEAFQYNVTDYLKLPITLPRFNIAVEKVLELSTRLKQNTTEERQEIYVKVDSRYIKLTHQTILYVEAYGDYVKVVTTDKTYTVYTKMNRIEEKLGHLFIRVHRKYIVNIDKIEDIEENTLVILKQVIPIARTYRAELMNRLNLL